MVSACVPERSRTMACEQLVLDLSRQDVCDYIVESVSKVSASALPFCLLGISVKRLTVGLPLALPREISTVSCLF
ncbi:hypothetical protein [Paenibacillus sp. NPDC055715]